MSALPQKADMEANFGDVCFVPILLQKSALGRAWRLSARRQSPPAPLRVVALTPSIPMTAPLCPTGSDCGRRSDYQLGEPA